MATEAEIDRALQAAAESVAGRKLSQDETNKLKAGFRSKAGGTYQRAFGAITESLGITEFEGRRLINASDNADRQLEELDRLVNPQKKP